MKESIEIPSIVPFLISTLGLPEDNDEEPPSLLRFEIESKEIEGRAKEREGVAERARTSDERGSNIVRRFAMYYVSVEEGVKGRDQIVRIIRLEQIPTSERERELDRSDVLEVPLVKCSFVCGRTVHPIC